MPAVSLPNPPNGLRPAGYGGQACSEPADEALEKFCARVKQLLGGEARSGTRERFVGVETSGETLTRSATARRVPVAVWAALIAVVLLAGATWMWQRRPASVAEQTLRQDASATSPKSAQPPKDLSIHRQRKQVGTFPNTTTRALIAAEFTGIRPVNQIR